MPKVGGKHYPYTEKGKLQPKLLKNVKRKGENNE